MPADPGIRLRFRVLLVPISEDGTERHDDAIDAGTTEVVLRLETGRPGPTMRDAGLDRYVRDVVAGIAEPRNPAGLVYREGADGPEQPDAGLPRGRRFESGEEYAARLEREDLTPHVSPGLPGTVPTPRDLPTPRDVPHRARRATFPAER